MFATAGLLLFLSSHPYELIVKQVSESGRVLLLAGAPSERLGPPAAIAPGAPPLLSFRFFEGRERHRFGERDMVIDDAGH